MSWDSDDSIAFQRTAFVGDSLPFTEFPASLEFQDPKAFFPGALRAAMRVLVTGPTNPVGTAVVRALANAGHEVRAFGVEPGADPFGLPGVAVFPGRIDLGGSLEPVASECQAIVHCAPFDAVEGSRAHRGMVLENSTLFARYAAERELVQRLVVVVPAQPDKADAEALARAEARVKATRPSVPYAIVRAPTPEAAARDVLAALAPLASTPPGA
jgi:uncharacterized protein YbjT (DUF2867 family)